MEEERRERRCCLGRCCGSACSWLGQDGGLWFTLFRPNRDRGSPSLWTVVPAVESQLTRPHGSPSLHSGSFSSGFGGWGSLKGLETPATLWSSSGLAATAASLRHWRDAVRAGLPGSSLAGCRLDFVKGKSEHIPCLKPLVPSRAKAPRSTLKPVDGAFVVSSRLSFQPHLGSTNTTKESGPFSLRASTRVVLPARAVPLPVHPLLLSQGRSDLTWGLIQGTRTVPCPTPTSGP